MPVDRGSGLHASNSRAETGSEAIANASQNQHQKSLIGTKAALGALGELRLVAEILQSAAPFGGSAILSKADQKRALRYLWLAIRHIEQPAPTGRASITDEGRAALGMAVIDDQIEQVGAP